MVLGCLSCASKAEKSVDKQKDLVRNYIEEIENVESKEEFDKLREECHERLEFENDKLTQEEKKEYEKNMSWEESQELKNLGIQFSAILPYSTSKVVTHDSKLDNLAVSKVQDYMIESEKRMVAELVKNKRLGQDSYLLKDGSLEYKVMKSGREDLRTLQKIKHNYQWVIGVSKSFNPESCLDHTGKPNSNYIADLPVYHRTPVARYENRDFLGDVQFGVWYIRLRDKRRTQTPFDGVVKVEKIMMDEEIEKGIDSDVIDLISANIINERNPTCYGTDRRWANHLYPVFLTESYVKSKYISTELFLQLF